MKASRFLATLLLLVVLPAWAVPVTEPTTGSVDPIKQLQQQLEQVRAAMEQRIAELQQQIVAKQAALAANERHQQKVLARLAAPPRAVATETQAQAVAKALSQERKRVEEAERTQDKAQRAQLKRELAQGRQMRLFTSELPYAVPKRAQAMFEGARVSSVSVQVRLVNHAVRFVYGVPAKLAAKQHFWPAKGYDPHGVHKGMSSNAYADCWAEVNDLPKDWLTRGLDRALAKKGTWYFCGGTMPLSEFRQQYADLDWQPIPKGEQGAAVIAHVTKHRARRAHRQACFNPALRAWAAKEHQLLQAQLKGSRSTEVVQQQQRAPRVAQAPARQVATTQRVAHAPAWKGQADQLIAKLRKAGVKKVDFKPRTAEGKGNFDIIAVVNGRHVRVGGVGPQVKTYIQRKLG